MRRGSLPPLLRGLRCPRWLSLAPAGWNGYRPSHQTKCAWQRKAYEDSLRAKAEGRVSIDWTEVTA